jgi:GT2 family glycosyltransferase
MDFSLIEGNEISLAGDSGKSYTFTFRSDIKKSDKLPVLMPTKDYLPLLKHNLKILKSSGVIEDIQLIIIDDRSTEDICGFCSSNNLGYIRIDNDYGFNYSVNMNIGAWFLYNLGFHTCMFLNNDCYIHNRDFLKEFLKRHYDSKSHLSGIKLVYPEFRLAFHKRMTTAMGKVQFGGGDFIDRTTLMQPRHYARGFFSSHPFANRDSDELFVTGACNIVDLETFIEHGGYNETMPAAYQDVFLALEYRRRNKKVSYFGKDIFFYHEETLSRRDESELERYSLLNYQRMAKELSSEDIGII